MIRLDYFWLSPETANTTTFIFHLKNVHYFITVATIRQNGFVRILATISCRIKSLNKIQSEILSVF